MIISTYSGRIFGCLLGFVGFFFIIFYKSTLVTHLTAVGYEKPITGVSGKLLTLTVMKLGLIREGSLLDEV